MTRAELEQYVKERIYPNNAQEITGEVLQNTLLAMVDYSSLTLTTKPNGNIEIGNLAGQTKEFMPATPSGDPMHAWYESLGAVWNASTGYWEFLGVNNMTNEQMLMEAKLGTTRLYPNSYLESYATNLQRVVFGLSNGLFNSIYKTLTLTNMMTNNALVEVVQFSTYDINSNNNYPVFVKGLTYSFANCVRLERILNVLDVSQSSSFNNTFTACNSLKIVYINGCKFDISFASSPLNAECATYLIANADASATFTITFRADRQAIYEANADFIAAKSEKPNITILYQ